MSNLQAIAEIETDDFFIEMVADFDLYFEPADHSVGIPGGYSPDGCDMVSVTVFDEDGETVWESDKREEITKALAFLTLAGYRPEAKLDDACSKELEGFDPRDYQCFAP